MYFVPTQKTTGGPSIQFLSFATNNISNIATLQKSSVWGLTVSRRGEWIAYGHEQESGSELMPVENFR